MSTPSGPQIDDALIGAVCAYLQEAFRRRAQVEHSSIPRSEKFAVRLGARSYDLHVEHVFFQRLGSPEMVTFWLERDEIAKKMDKGKAGGLLRIRDVNQIEPPPEEQWVETAVRRCPNCQHQDIAFETTALDPPPLKEYQHFCECKGCGARFIYRSR